MRKDIGLRACGPDRGRNHYCRHRRSVRETDVDVPASADDDVSAVRRQSFWDSELGHLREALARLVGDVMRLADDAASVDWRWSVV